MIITQKYLTLSWQYCRDESALADDNTITDFNESNAITDSLKIKEKKNDRSKNENGTINVEIIVPLKHLCNFFRNLEFYLINCKFSLEPVATNI